VLLLFFASNIINHVGWVSVQFMLYRSL